MIAAHICPEETACFHPQTRQLQILELVARGMPTRRIASRLGIAEQTVKNQISSLHAALESGDRVTLVLKAAKAGLLDLGPILAEL